MSPHPHRLIEIGQAHEDGASGSACTDDQYTDGATAEEAWRQADKLIEGVDSLRPLASEALLALFKLRMTTQLEDAFGKVIEHQAKRK